MRGTDRVVHLVVRGRGTGGKFSCKGQRQGWYILVVRGTDRVAHVVVRGPRDGTCSNMAVRLQVEI